MLANRGKTMRLGQAIHRPKSPFIHKAEGAGVAVDLYVYNSAKQLVKQIKTYGS